MPCIDRRGTLYCADIKEYLNLESEALRVLSKSKALHESRESSIMQSINSAFKQTNGSLFKCLKLDFSFMSDVFGPIQHKVSFGAYMQCDDNSLTRSTYSIEVFDQSPDPGKIISRIHFDYASRQECNAKHHPIFHIQTWGKLPPHLREKGISYCDDNGFLSFPRVAYFPLSFAMFFTMIVKELGTERMKKIVAHRDWLSVVMNHEKHILLPFLESLADSIRNQTPAIDYWYKTNV